jgi:hypothetical protein
MTDPGYVRCMHRGPWTRLVAGAALLLLAATPLFVEAQPAGRVQRVGLLAGGSTGWAGLTNGKLL